MDSSQKVIGTIESGNGDVKPLIAADRRQVLAGGAALVAGGALLRAQGAGAATGAGARFDEIHDVIVVGTGAAGCSAALFAHEAGSEVLVLEKGAAPGGTSAKSGGGYWIPNNSYLAAEGAIDPRDDFLRYAARCAFPGEYNAQLPHYGIPASSYALLEAFYDNAAKAIDGLSDMGALKSAIMRMGTITLPDYHAELPENKLPTFRTLQVVPRVAGGPTVGDEMIGQLMAGIRQRKMDVRVRHRVQSLVRNSSGRVIGVTVETGDGEKRTFGARKGVVFATGGFAHNQELLNRYHIDPVFGSCAAPTSTGDIIPIAASVGAKLGNMGCAWRAPVVLEEAARYVSVPTDVFMIIADSMVTVNRYGRRGLNERRAYHDRALAMYRWDGVRQEYPDIIQFAIYDRRAAELFAGAMPLPLTPAGMEYVVEGADYEDLAAKLNERLTQLTDKCGKLQLADDFAQEVRATVQRFNGFANSGVDADFGRGSGKIDQLEGPAPERPGWETNRKPSPVMFPIADKGPYYAIILAPGVLDTTGGPVIDARARIVDSEDRPIPGLYGAGNCIATAARNAYWAAGATLGLCFTFGMIAGRECAAQTAEALA